MQVWRICKDKHIKTAFSGDGGLYTAGRWTVKGVRAVYTAESLALATLEVFVHINGGCEGEVLPMSSICAVLPDDLEIEEIDIGTLPVNWREISAYPKLQEIGDEWIKSKRTPILKVPSAIVPVEYNYIINPEHPDFMIDNQLTTTFSFDTRMWSQQIYTNDVY